MAATYEEMIAKARELEAAGNVDDARRVAQIAIARRNGAAPQGKSTGQKVKEFFVGDDDPTTQNAGEKIGSFLNKAGEALTFGLIGDEAFAAAESIIPGVNYKDRRDHYRQQEEVFERDNPALALGADIGGAVAGAALPVGMAARSTKGLWNLGKAAVTSSAAGAGGSGVYGFMEGEGGLKERAIEGRDSAYVGAGVGAAVPVIGAGVKRAADAFVGNRAIRQAARNAPTSQQLLEEGSRLYDDVDRAGVEIKADVVEGARQRIIESLKASTAFSERPGGKVITPNSSAVMRDMGDMTSEMLAQADSAPALPFKELDHLRRQAGAAAGNVANRSDQKAGTVIIEQLDELVKGLGDADVVSGDPKALQSAIEKARSTWSRMMKSQQIDDAIAQQGNYLSGDASAIRNAFARILRNKKLSRGYTEAELAAMRKVVNPGTLGQMLNYAGSGLGMMGQLGLGMAAGPFGALAGAGAAAASRKASEALTSRNAEIARALVAGGKLNKLPVASPRVRTIAEQLMRQGTAASQQ